MGKMWVIPFQGTITAAGTDSDLWTVNPADDKPVQLRAVILGQISEVKDAEEEGLRIDVLRMNATITAGTGGAAAVPEDPLLHGQTPGFTARTNDTTLATTTGSTDILGHIGWNNRNTPLEKWYPDERFAPRAIQGEALIVRLMTTVADDMTFAGEVWVEEL